jgi:hypothetical protein
VLCCLSVGVLVLVRRRIEWGGVCERIVESGLGTRSDIFTVDRLTEFGASA